MEFGARWQHVGYLCHLINKDFPNTGDFFNLFHHWRSINKLHSCHLPVYREHLWSQGGYVLCSPIQPEQDSTVRIHILQLNPTWSPIHPHEWSMMFRPPPPPAAVSSQCAVRPQGSRRWCAAFILHRLPVTKFPPGRSTGWCAREGAHGANLDTRSSAGAAAETSTASIQDKVTR